MTKLTVPPKDRGLSDATLSFFNTVAERAGKIDKKGAFRPVILTDAVAENNSIYFSSDQNKLVYKDSGGIVNDLY